MSVQLLPSLSVPTLNKWKEIPLVWKFWPTLKHQIVFPATRKLKTKKKGVLGTWRSCDESTFFYANEFLPGLVKTFKLGTLFFLESPYGWSASCSVWQCCLFHVVDLGKGGAEEARNFVPRSQPRIASSPVACCHRMTWPSAVVLSRKKIKEEKYIISFKQGFITVNFLSSYSLRLSRRSKKMFHRGRCLM